MSILFNIRFNMSLMELEEYNDGSIMYKLKDAEDYSKILLTIINLAFTDISKYIIQHLINHRTAKIRNM